MSALLYIGICCMLISIWGVIQLGLMGLMFFYEVPILFEEVEPEDYGDYDDFIRKTKENYFAVATNCWIAAAIYVITLGLSCFCLKKANKKAALEAKLQEDDEYVCRPPAPVVKKEKNIK